MAQRLAVVGFIIAAIVAIFAFVQQQQATQQASAALVAQAEADERRVTAVALAQDAAGTQVQAEAGQATAVRQVEEAGTAQAEAKASASAIAAQAELAQTALARGESAANTQMTEVAATLSANADDISTLQAQSTAVVATVQAQMQAEATEEAALVEALATVTAQIDLAQFAASAAEEDRSAALAQAWAAQTQVAQLESDLATAQFRLTGLPPVPTLPATNSPPPTAAPTETPQPSVEPVTVGDIVLTQRFVTQDGIITFFYPEDWVAVESNGAIGVSNDADIQRTSDAGLETGQVYLDIFTITGSELGGVPEGTTVLEVAGVLVDNISAQPDSPFAFDPPTGLNLGDFPAASAQGTNGVNDLILYLVDVGDGTYVAASGNAALGELSTFEPTLRAILDTLAYST
jgi:hypothetical protein